MRRIAYIHLDGISISNRSLFHEITANTVAHIEQPTMDQPQSTSMIEDAEMGGNTSCVANCADPAPLDEINGTDITKEPMVARAIEMFEAKKIRE